MRQVAKQRILHHILMTSARVPLFEARDEIFLKLRVTEQHTVKNVPTMIFVHAEEQM